MQLIYKIPDKLYYIKNFLDYSTYKKLHYDVFKSKFLDLKSTEKEWESGLKYGYKNRVKKTILDINYPPLQKIKILLENNIFHKIKVKDFEPILHSMDDGAGINWHKDGSYDYGITYYINHKWQGVWGGEFLFQHESSNGFIPLVGNSLVIVKTPLLHKVTPIMKPLIPRKTIQIFI